MTGTGTIEINDIFDLAFRFVTETNENIFLTGKAGTGKTTFLKYLQNHCSKNIIVTAPTGVAAINAGGVTLHSMFQLPFHPFVPTINGKNDLLQKLRFTTRRLDLLRKMDILVIDEISMVRSDTLDAIDTILRHVRRRENLSFGGVQVLFIGDLYQLPPVATYQDWGILQEFYPSEFFFDSQVIRNDMPVLIELKKIFRQKEDSFINILNKVRNNDMDTDDFDKLHSRYIPDFNPAKTEKYITLTSHNLQADRINYHKLLELGKVGFTYKAEIENDFPESMYPAEETLELKLGAQVMFLRNDPEKRFFNGKIGTVKSLDNDEIIVESDGKEINIGRETWENTRYTLNRNDGKLEQEVVGTFTQFPLRLAWAITIHKSQGLTFDKVMIDAGSAFSSGQVYVALSRCTSLEGIVLLTRIPSSAILCNANVVESQQRMSPRGSLAERFEGARQVYTQQLLDELFSFNDVNNAIEFLAIRIGENLDRLNEEALPWVRNIISEFSANREIGLKFINHIGNHLLSEPVIEKNKDLQKRITDAARHFSPAFIKLKDSVMHHPVVTEHREASRPVDEALNEVVQSLLYLIYLLEYCKQPFSVADYLRQKLRYAVPRVSVSSYGSKRKEKLSDIPNQELFEELKEWRNKICEETDLPIYMVANQKTLTEIATYLPLTQKDLMKISGFGKAKTENYGNEITEMVNRYCEKKGIKSTIEEIQIPERKKKKEREEKKQKEPKVSTQTISYNLYKEGKTIAEIAKERNMVISTIETHLSTYIANGLIDINDLVSEEDQKLILESAAKFGWESLRVLKDNLPEHISFGQLRMTKVTAKIE